MRPYMPEAARSLPRRTGDAMVSWISRVECAAASCDWGCSCGNLWQETCDLGYAVRGVGREL